MSRSWSEVLDDVGCVVGTLNVVLDGLGLGLKYLMMLVVSLEH